jgi:hypothetical protein
MEKTSYKSKASNKSETSMNKELQEWINEAKDDVKKLIEKEENNNATDSKPKGICKICGKNQAKFVCLKCQGPVCPSCYFNIIGVCKTCVPREYVEKWEKKNPNWRKILEIEWVD